MFLSENPAYLSIARSVNGNRWEANPVNDRLALALSQRFDLPEIAARVMTARGIDLETAEDFLDPTLRSMVPDPSSLQDMEKGIQHIYDALSQKKHIAVFGDYDVDGATSAALLYRYFKKLGYELTIYIPDRMQEGYGPNSYALQKLKQKGIDLVILVDCGATAFDVLDAVDDQGPEIIILDHHMSEPRLPKALAVINPNRWDDDSALGYLAAVGVVFLFLVGLNRYLRDQKFFQNQQISEPDLMILLDIVALGTVCDVVPLIGLNRAFVAQGLKVMAKRQNPGLAALSDIAGVNAQPTAYHLGYILGPRVNAGGRVGESSLGAKLLSGDEALVQKIASQLNQFNEARKAIETDCFEQAVAMVESQAPTVLHRHLVFVAAVGWHAGVIGIVATRLKERYQRPACVVTIENGVGKGSGRSVEGVDLGAAIIAARQAGVIDKGGGHKMAAGFTLMAEKISEFSQYLAERIENQVQEGGIQARLRLDGTVSLQGANATLCAAINRLEPFGAGNAEPRFVIPDTHIIKSDIVGEQHVRVILSDGQKSLKAIAFRSVNSALGDVLLSAKRRERLHIAGKIRRDSWLGHDKIQVIIEDAALINQDAEPGIC